MSRWYKTASWSQAPWALELGLLGPASCIWLWCTLGNCSTSVLSVKWNSHSTYPHRTVVRLTWNNLVKSSHLSKHHWAQRVRLSKHQRTFELHQIFYLVMTKEWLAHLLFCLWSLPDKFPVWWNFYQTVPGMVTSRQGHSLGFHRLRTEQEVKATTPRWISHYRWVSHLTGATAVLLTLVSWLNSVPSPLPQLCEPKRLLESAPYEPDCAQMNAYLAIGKSGAPHFLKDSYPG